MTTENEVRTVSAEEMLHAVRGVDSLPAQQIEYANILKDYALTSGPDGGPSPVVGPLLMIVGYLVGSAEALTALTRSFDQLLDELLAEARIEMKTDA